MQDLLAKFADQLLTNPYPAYHVIRKLDPVHWSPSWNSWFLTRLDDVALVMKDTRFTVGQVSSFSARLDARGLSSLQLSRVQQQLRRIEGWLASFLLFTDPPAHSRLRALITKAFTPKSVEQLGPLIEDRVQTLLDYHQTGETVDLLKVVAIPLPVMTIADFLGSRPDDYQELQDWSHDLASFLGNDILTPVVIERSLAALEGMEAYFQALMQERRRSPQEDLMSRLLQAQHEGSTLTESEILSMCILLFGAGHDTTTNFIANGLHALLQHPSEATKLTEQPELLDRAVEEVLRFDSPSLIASRTASQDVELGGKLLRSGDSINLCMGAANRDPQHFREPDRFVIERENQNHIAFGRGMHFCVGSFLAKLEARTVFRLFFQRWPQSQIVEVPERIPTLAFRRLKNLKVQLKS